MKKIIISSLILLCALSQQLFAGGFIVVTPDKHRVGNVRPPVNPNVPNPNLFPIETRSTKVEAKIFAQSAITSIDQVFYNPTNRQLEGYFLFPVPEGVVVNKFTMFVNGVETEAEILDATKARKIYEDIVRSAKDPALLEYSNEKLFRVRIFPILPRSEQRIRLTYSENLIRENNTMVYTFPLNTEKYSAKPVQNVSFKVDIETKEDLKNIYCPTHQVEINRKSEHMATVGYEANNARSDRDFQLYYSTDRSKVGLSLLTHKEKRKDGFFFLNLSPGLAKKHEISQKDITFVLDASGSMAGDKMEQAQKALTFCVENLNSNDRFEIIRFSTEASSLFGELKTASKETRKDARDYIDDLKAIGGTNIDEALDMALQAKTKEGRPHFIVFITDGKPTIGEIQTEALLGKLKDKNTSNTRIFTFGIGTTLNTHLLDQLTEMTQAHRTYALPDEDVEIKLSDFYTKVSSPILTDIKVSFDKSVRVENVFPRNIPDMFKGSTFTLMGRFKGSGKGKVYIEGMINGKKERFEYVVDFEDETPENEFIPPLWAARNVGYLLDQIRLHGETSEVRDEVVRLAKKYGIVTPYTSFLIIEDEANLVRRNQIQLDDQLVRGRTQSAPPRVMEEQERTWKDSKKESGIESIEVSSANQSLNDLSNISEADFGADVKLNYTDNLGNNKNLASDIEFVRGRAMYNNNNIWVDSNIQSQKTNKKRRIEFNSSEYFKLLRTSPEAADLMALGNNVRFILNDELIEIFD